MKEVCYEVSQSGSICHCIGRSYIQLKGLLNVNPMQLKWWKMDDFWQSWRSTPLQTVGTWPSTWLWGLHMVLGTLQKQ